MDPRLQRLLGGDELSALRRRLRRYFERATLGATPGATPAPLRLGSLTAAERESLALLTGQAPREAKSMLIDLGLLDAALRDAGVAGSLREALEQIDGPIVHLASVRAAAQAGWSAVVDACAHTALAGCLQTPAALGLLKRLSRTNTAVAARLVEGAAAVLSRLPAGGTARAQLAAETLGSAHALDNGQPIATLVLAAWRQIERDRLDAADLGDPADGPDLPTLDESPDESLEEPPDEVSGSAPGRASDERARDVWARAGVLVNELARPALFLNVPLHADEALVGAPGEPAYLSLRRLLRAPPRWAVAGLPVFVCENPNLVAIAADRLGERCAPLVCTDGMPAAAQRTLLSQLTQSGAHLRYHGDFDWPGVRIANHVMRACGAKPWRFDAADYEIAAERAPHTQRDLDDARVAASWDAALAPAMQRHGLAIAEEAVAAFLLRDLGQG